jgi:hypothetical protein
VRERDQINKPEKIITNPSGRKENSTEPHSKEYRAIRDYGIATKNSHNN